MNIYKTIFCGLLLFSTLEAGAQQASAAARKLSMAEYAISNFYVDQVNEEKLVEDAIVAMLEKLDPHSSYSNAEETKELNEPLTGNFEGIGIQFQMLNDTLFIVQTIAGGPSEKVGVQSGDKIITVNDTTIAGVKMKQTDIMKRLRGKKGSIVNVGIQRRNVADIINFKISRDKIPIHSIDTYYKIDNNIGYIKINRFGATTHQEFVDALKELKKSKVKNLIVDLQGNGGGYLKAAVDIADEFLPKDRLIVYTDGLKAKREEAISNQNGEFIDGKLVILVDESSASASEIVSGAIQDWDRGVIIGRRTFGKGLVQRPIPLIDGSMIRLTVARYYTPSGRSIQRPYESGNSEKYHEELLNRYKAGELLHADSINFPDSLKTKTLVVGRTVYGGGGIMPDIFIPIDTTRFTNYHRDIIRKGVMNKTILSFVDQNREDLKKEYKSKEEFISKYKVSQELTNMLTSNANTESITQNEEEYTISKPLIELQLKALVGRDLFDIGVYYQIMNIENQSLTKAVELLKDEAQYRKALQ